MKKKMFPLIASLLLLSLLVVISAQTSSVQIGPYGNLKIGPYGNLKIGPYGNLVGLTDTQGKDVLGQMREGYAIAYQVKNPKAGNEDRLSYALGDQLSSGLTIEKSTKSIKVVITSDKALEISRSLTWDEKSNTLKSHITITNIGTGDVAVTGIEIQLDDRSLVALMGQQAAKDILVLPARVRASAEECEDCPVPVCHIRCSLGQARAAFGELNDSNDDAPFASRLPQFGGSLFRLTWPKSNLKNPTLRRGEKMSVHSWFVLGR